MKRVVWCCVFALCLLGVAAAHAQENPEVSHIGRGGIQGVAWHATGDYLLVSTITGAWLYTPDLKDLTHLDGIQLATLSPDGNYIAGVDADSRIRLWDATTFAPVESPDYGLFRQVTVLSWSPNGRYLAASGSDDESLTYAWDFANDGESIIATHIAGDSLSWSPAGTQLAIYGSSGNGQIYVFHLASNVSGPTGAMLGSQITWQDETHLLAMAWDEGTTATLWDVVTAKQIKSWTFPLPSAAYNHAGDKLAIVGPRDLSIVDAASNQKLSSTSVASDYYRSLPPLAWSHNDRWIATGVASHGEVEPGQVGIIDMQTGAIVHTLEDVEQAVQQLAWSPDDRKLAVVDTRQQFVIYDTETGTVSSRTSAHTLAGETLAWNLNGTRIALADSLDSVRLWNPRDIVQESVFSSRQFPVTRIKWQPSGDLIAAQGHSVNGRQSDFQIWDTNTKRNVTDQFQLPSDVDLFDWSFTGEQFAALAGDRFLIWDFPTRQMIVSESGVQRGGPDGDLRWSPSRRYVALLINGAGMAGPLVYDRQSGVIGGVPAANVGGSVAWSDNDVLVSIDWDARTPTLIEPRLSRFRAPSFAFSSWATLSLPGLVYNAADGKLSPNGHFVAFWDSAGDGVIAETLHGNPIAMLANVAQVVWAPNDTGLAVLRTDGSLWLLDAGGTIEQQLPRPSGQVEIGGQFFWSPDGGKLAYLHRGVVDLWTLS